MKKTSYILALLMSASALLLSSCAKEKASGAADGDLVECTLQADVIGTGADLDIDSKVALNVDGVTPNWEEGDKILVLDVDKKPVGENGIFTLSSGAGKASGEFKGKVNVGQTPKYAIYPASAATVSGTDPVTAGTLSAPAGNDAGTIKAAVMLGSSSDSGKTFSFTNACAVLKFNTGDYGKSGGTDPAIKKVKVSASYGEDAAPVAGAFDINWTATPPSIVAASSGAVSELTVELPSTLPTNDKDVYIPIFPLAKNSSEVAPSMKYEFTNASGVAKISYDFSDAIAFNTLKNLGTAKDLEFSSPGPDPNYWVDLGMVSERGYPLYISKYNVKSIDDNGKVEFENSEDEFGMEVGIHQATSMINRTFYFGELKCRVLSSSDALSLLYGDNFIIEGYSEGGDQRGITYYVTITSNFGNNNHIVLPVKYDSSYGPAYCCIGSVFSHRNDHCYFGVGVNLGGPCYVRMVYEDEDESKKVSFNTCEWGYQIPDKLILRPDDEYQTLIPEINDAPQSYYSSCWIVYKLSADGIGYTCVSNSIESVCDDLQIVADQSDWEDGILHGFSEGQSGGGVDIFDANFSYSYKGSPSFSVHIHLEPECFVKGTLITLADGSKKPVEDITYDDVVKVWNFDKGCYDSAKVLWLTRKGLKNDHYIKCTFSDGTVLNVTGKNSHHKLYNCDERYFQGVTKMEPGTRVFTENGVVTLVSKEWIEEDVEYYNVITDRHINCFANGVLTSARYNNTYPIDEDMRFVKDGRKVRPYKEFKAVGISREWYDGLRLGEQTDSLESIRKYIDKVESQMLDKPESENPGFFARIWNWIKGLFGR